MAPAGGSANTISSEKPTSAVILKQKNVSVKALIKRLGEQDVKIAVVGAKKLIRIGKKAIPELLNALENEQNHELPARALAVLNKINWKLIDTKTQKKAVAKMFPLLLKFEPGGRTRESYLAESAMLKIGTHAMPAFVALLKSEFNILKMLSLSALNEVEWTKISSKKALEVKDALGVLAKNRISPLGEMAKSIIIKINKVYRTCMNENRQGNVVDMHAWKKKNEQETGNGKLETDIGGELYGKKAA